MVEALELWKLFEFDYALLLRLVAATFFGGVIGLERAGKHHHAGLRTHIIVCLGAASVMVVSECIVSKYGTTSEYMRMGAQIVSGIGFLGAGNIIADGNKIRGITTAAGLWTTACVGIIVGSGFYILAFTVVLFMLFAMLVLKPIISRRTAGNENYIVKGRLDTREQVKTLIDNFQAQGIEVSKLQVKPAAEGVMAVLEIQLRSYDKEKNFVSELWSQKGEVEWVSIERDEN